MRQPAINPMSGKDKFTLLNKIKSAPVVDKFFICGAFCSIYGMLYLGSYLWLSRSGQITPPKDYLNYRYAHIYIQFYGFFSCFILGFVFQAASKLFASSVFVNRLCVLLSPVVLLSAVFLSYTNTAYIGKILVCLIYIATAGFLLPLISKENISRSSGTSLLIITSLVSFMTGIFTDLGNPLVAISLFWGAVAAAVFAAGQLFIQGTLKGAKLQNKSVFTFHGLYFLTYLLFIISAFNFSSLLIRAAGLSSLIAISYYISACKIYRGYKTVFTSIGLAYFFALIWALTGSLLLIFIPEQTDSVLHIWSTGWGVVLILAMAPRIVGFLFGKKFFSDGTILLMVITWQAVPLGRGFGSYLPGWISWFVSGASILVFIPWTFAMLLKCLKIFRRQFFPGNIENIICH